MVPGGSFQNLLGVRPVLGVRDLQVGGEPVREGADFARGAAGRGLAREREGRVAGSGDLPRQEMQVVDKVVRPGAASVLVEAHGPGGHDLDVRIGVERSQRLEPAGLDTRHLHCPLERIGCDEGGIFLEADRLGVVGVLGVLGCLLQRVVGAEAVADVLVAVLEVHEVGDKRLVDRARLDDVVGDVVEDDEVGLRREDDGDVGEVEAALAEGREHRDLDVRIAEAAVGDPRPEDRVHLGHVRAPEHEGVGVLDIVVAAHRLVDAEGAHEAGDG